MSRKTRELTMTAIIPAMMAATAGISIPMGLFPPITMQTFFVMLAGLFLGARLGGLCMFVYVMLGAIGLPVFAGYQGGIGVILGPTGGFIISFIFSAFIIGKMKNVKIINRVNIDIFLKLMIGNLIIYMFGCSYMAISLNMTLLSSIAIMLPYLFGDLIKIMLVIYSYVSIRSHVTYEWS